MPPKALRVAGDVAQIKVEELAAKTGVKELTVIVIALVSKQVELFFVTE